MSDVKVKGLSELNAFLQQLPAKVEKNVLRGALRAGAKLMLAAAKANAPVGVPNKENVRLYGGYEGALRDSIRLTPRRGKPGQVIWSVTAGGKSKKTKADVYYAHFVEYGTSAHVIKPQKGSGKGYLQFGGIFAKSVMHPGARAKPFMRPALDSQARPAVVAAAEYMKRRLASKHGLDTEDVEIDSP